MYIYILFIIALCLGFRAEAAVHLNHAPQYAPTPVQECLHVKDFSFDRKQQDDGYLLGWKINLKSNCLKHKDVKIFYELTDAAGTSLSYAPLGTVTGHIRAGESVDVADTAHTEQDPMYLGLKFHAVTRGESGTTENFPLYSTWLKPEEVPVAVPDPLEVEKETTAACFKEFVVKNRAIAESWRLTHIWWQLSHSDANTCRFPIYTQLTVYDAHGKELEKSDVFEEFFTREIHDTPWHKEPIRTSTYDEAAKLEVTLATRKNEPETIFKTLVVTPPELENW